MDSLLALPAHEPPLGLPWGALALWATVLAALLAYGQGVARLWGRAGVGRGVRRWQAVAGVVGFLVLGLALTPPVEGWAGRWFWAHMLQHLLLLFLAAPLLVLGEPWQAALWLLPPAARAGLGRAGRPWHRLGHPLVAWLLYAGALWLWHLPALYGAAWANDALHALEHGSFLGAALLFWGSVAHLGRRGTRQAGVGVLYLFTAGVQGGLLGALVTLAPTPWYRPPTAAPGPLGPLEDQQLGGALMWLSGSVVHLLAAALLFVMWLAAWERWRPTRPIKPLEQQGEGRG